MSLVNLCATTNYATTPGLVDIRGSDKCIYTNRLYSGTGFTIGGLQNMVGLQNMNWARDLQNLRRPHVHVGFDMDKLQNLRFGDRIRRGIKKAAPTLEKIADKTVDYTVKLAPVALAIAAA